MCIICISYEKDKITFDEARKHLREMKPALAADHVKELEEKFKTSDEDICSTSFPETDIMWSFNFTDIWD